MSKKPDMIQISEAELLSMTRDLDEVNRDVCEPAQHEALADMHESIHESAASVDGLRDRRLGRRTFLLGAGAVAVGGVALAACGSSSPSPSTTTTAGESSADLASDLKIVALAASLENLAVTAYGDAISAITAGKYGSVPAAVPTFATTAKSQHASHAAAWNNILTGAGKKAVTGVPTSLANSVVSAFTSATNAKSLPSLLTLALSLENTAAQTYQVASTAVYDVKGIQVAASIQPVEMQHAAILYFVLGKYPGIQMSNGTPLAFNPVTSAASTSDYTGPE